MEFFPNVRTREETIALIDKSRQHMIQYGYSMYACELKETHQFIGVVGLIHCDTSLPVAPNIEIAWRIAKEYWGQGFAVEASKKCLEIGFNEFKLNEIIALTAKINKKSERVMQKLGMINNGNEDCYHPKLLKEHPLSLHVLYRLTKDRWNKFNEIG